MMNQIRISHAVLAYRRREGISQGQFGEKFGVSAQAVSKWEREICCPDITLLPHIAKVLGLTIEEMLFGLPALDK